MHSLGFKTSQDKSGPVPLPTSPKSASATADQKLVLSESDKLNGNNQGPEPPSSTTTPASPPSADQDGAAGSAPVRRRVKPVCAAAKQPAARASMGAIIKGSVMDKVTHVFNNAGVSSMGNANNSKTSASDKQAALRPEKSPPPLPASVASGPPNSSKNNKDIPEPVGSVISANDVKQQLAGTSGSPSGINIPKGN